MGMCWSSSSSSQISNVKTQSSAPVSSGVSTTEMSKVTFSDNSTSSGNSGSSASTFNGDSYPNGKILPHPNLKVFSFIELRAATKNFRADMVLGEGGFGKVYKGFLDDKSNSNSKSSSGTIIAVKKLKAESDQGFQEWQSEINFLGKLSHPNLVKLLGYCWDEKELLLVYEFMQKGSLENHLFGRGSTVQPLSWDLRFKILMGAAHGLEFLHSFERQVIYRDFKASNILLDGSYNAKISDFGLAKIGPTASQSHLSTQIIGTDGYAAPEYVATGHLYVKSDVYGYGMVLVEMITGLRAVDKNRIRERHNLVEWIKPHLNSRRKLKHVMDSNLQGRYPSRAALVIAQLALKCIESEPKMRPSMKEVVETLKQVETDNEKPKEASATVQQLHTAQRHHRQHHQHQSLQHMRNGGHPSYPLPQRV